MRLTIGVMGSSGGDLSEANLYLLSGWLQRRCPGLDVLSHDAGHSWETPLGRRGDPHLNPLHLFSNVLIAGGFILLVVAWRVLYAAQQRHHLATAGAYAYLQHPQYAGFILIMLGFLLQWSTVFMLAIFPILVAMYVRLAHREERGARAEFGEAYARYAAIPRHSSPGCVERLRGQPDAHPRTVCLHGGARCST